MLDYAVKVAPEYRKLFFGFSVLRDYDLKEYPVNLYLKGYDRQTRLLDPNVLSHVLYFICLVMKSI
jgi:hypothetical protein